MILLLGFILLALGVLFSVLGVIFKLAGCIIWCGLVFAVVGGGVILGMSIAVLMLLIFL